MITYHARAIRKSYGNRLILDLDLSFAGSRLHVILGPNGCGKSTLLRLLALLGLPDSGEVQILEDARLLEKDRPTRQRIVLTPRPAGLFNQSVANNILYGLKLRRIGSGERQRRLQQVLEEVGLAHLRKANALTLSSGEKQRLCLAMAMAVRPEVILLDEPTSSLDPHNVLQVEKIIARMKQEARMIILVTHNISQAERLADTVTFMGQDRSAQQSEAAVFFATDQAATLDGYL